MTEKEKAQKLYSDTFIRWCYELSHDENVSKAKSICEYICNEVLGDMGADRGYEFWKNVKNIITESTHDELYHITDIPCEPDHNGECLICDCWPSDCAYIRYTNKDYSMESREELKKMFKNFVNKQ